MQHRNKKGQFCKKPKYDAEWVIIGFGLILVTIHAYFGGFQEAIDYARGLL